MSREITEKRREAVWEQLARGLPYAVIARTLGVHPNTIANDAKVLRERHGQTVKTIEPPAEIGDIAAKYDEVYKYAMQEYSQCQDEKLSQKAGFLEKALAALKSKSQLLLDTGYLPKASNEGNYSPVIDGVDVKKASLTELKALREKLQSGLEVIRGGDSKTDVG